MNVIVLVVYKDDRLFSTDGSYLSNQLNTFVLAI